MSEDDTPDREPYAPEATGSSALTIYQPETSPAEMVAIRAQQMELVASMMVPGVHYGKVPGAKRPSLWQPGAQLLDVHHGFSTSFELVDKVEDWTSGFFSYTYRCRLTHRRSGIPAGEGIGSCNSQEKKYREAKYHSGDDAGKPVNPRDIVNTLIKMACKRAHVAATLNATGMAEAFTQDVEDMTDQGAGGNGGNASLGVCALHNKPLRKGDYGLYCHTRVTGADGKERWCKGTSAKPKKAAPAKAAPAAGEPVDKATGEIFPTRDAITNVGQLLTASLNFFGLSRAETLDALGKKDTLDIADPGAEWEKLIEKYQEQGEPPTET